MHRYDASALMGVYMKISVVTGRRAFIFCCARWPDMAAIKD